jgi:fructokinase
MILVAGENVTDLLAVPDGLLRPALGGGPANTAVAAARLMATVGFVGRFGSDAFGRAFRERLASAGVDLSHAPDVDAPSSLALATIDADGVATYDFWLNGAADFMATDLPVPGDGDILHVGSLAAYWPPGAATIESWLRKHRDRATVTFDVNLRPIVLASHGDDALARLDRLVRLAHVVKASVDDVTLAYPGADPETVARGWLEGVPTGPRLVVLTQGADGVTALTRDGGRMHVPAPIVTVADTIGAGDAAMGALLARLQSEGLDGVIEKLEPVLRHVCAVAALACTRPGAYAPTPSDIETI